MKIGIISDTHKKVGRAKKAIDLLKENSVDYILHAGDIVKEEVLEYLENISIPYIAVMGNNDYNLYSVIDKYNLKTEPYYFKLDNKRFKLMHYPKYMFPLDTDIIVYGHTHKVDISFNGKNLILNPGEVCARDYDFSTFMILEIEPKLYRVSLFSRKIKTDIWNKETKEFTIN